MNYQNDNQLTSSQTQLGMQSSAWVEPTTSAVSYHHPTQYGLSNGMSNDPHSTFVNPNDLFFSKENSVHGSDQWIKADQNLLDNKADPTKMPVEDNLISSKQQRADAMPQFKCSTPPDVTYQNLNTPDSHAVSPTLSNSSSFIFPTQSQIIVNNPTFHLPQIPMYNNLNVSPPVMTPPNMLSPPAGSDSFNNFCNLPNVPMQPHQPTYVNLQNMNVPTYNPFMPNSFMNGGNYSPTNSNMFVPIQAGQESFINVPIQPNVPLQSKNVPMQPQSEVFFNTNYHQPQNQSGVPPLTPVTPVQSSNFTLSAPSFYPASTSSYARSNASCVSGSDAGMTNASVDGMSEVSTMFKLPESETARPNLMGARKYKCIRPCRVRKGHSMFSPKVTDLKVGTEIVVDTHGMRCHITAPVEGWISRCTENGQLIKLIEEDSNVDPARLQKPSIMFHGIHHGEITEPEFKKILEDNGQFPLSVYIPPNRAFGFASFATHKQAENCKRKIHEMKIKDREISCVWSKRYLKEILPVRNY